MDKTLYPLLYQVNTRVWLTELTHKKGTAATLDDLTDEELDKLKDYGFDWIWLLSVWQTGTESRRVSRENPGWRKEFKQTLPDLAEDDIKGSGFAIAGYYVSEELGGNEALSRLRQRLNSRGMKLMLDFVPNHTALDHKWIHDHPDFYIRRTEHDLEREPMNNTRITLENGSFVFAHGRDPYYPGWPDTLQLNYGNPDLQQAMMNELARIAGQCDGVRCDMAMLVLPDVFEKTWGIKTRHFWPEAIKRSRRVNPGFCLMAEVYWDLEWTMLQTGFDYAYDKRLYDRLKDGNVKAAREHLFASADYQARMVRFLENHDELRAAFEFPAEKHQAAAIITYLSPGMRFFHNGQFQGRIKKISPHLVRAPEEAVNNEIEEFYLKLMSILDKPLFRQGRWQLLNCHQAWESNWSHQNYISFAWSNDSGEKAMVAVNYSDARSQCYVKLPFHDLSGSKWLLKDLISGILYERDGRDLKERGLYIDEGGWKIYVFTLNTLSAV